MKTKLLFVLSVIVLKSASQTDTVIIHNYSTRINNTHNKDAYYIFENNGIVLYEGLKENGYRVGVQKEYYDNGIPKNFSEYRYLPQDKFSYQIGIYVEFYETGVIKTEGFYQLADSIECVSCYDIGANLPITRAHTRLMRTGVWKIYHPNGQLKTSGHYKGIHETTSVYHENKLFYKVNEPLWMPGGYAEEYLKDGLWLCYNTNGQLIKEEFYYKGMLASLYEYDR